MATEDIEIAGAGETAAAEPLSAESTRTYPVDRNSLNVRPRPGHALQRRPHAAGGLERPDLLPVPGGVRQRLLRDDERLGRTSPTASSCPTPT